MNPKSLRLLTPILLGLLAPTAFAQANDDFAGATTIATALPVTISGEDNSAASAESGEPDHGESTFNQNVATSSLWYSFTPTTSSAVAFEVLNSSTGLDSVISLYTGTSVTSLTLVLETDSFVAGTDEILTAQVAGGTTYFIAVDSATPTGAAAATGSYDFQVTEVPIPANDQFANATVISPILPITISNENAAAASVEVDEPEHGIITSFNENTNSLWYSYTPANATTVSITATPLDDAMDSIIAVYQGTSLSDLELVSERDGNFEGEEELLIVNLIGGTEYFIAVEALANMATAPFAGEYDISFEEYLDRPDNNDFADAEDLGSDSPLFASGTTKGADTEATDPIASNSSDNITSQSVWYSWTPPADGTYNISAESFNFSPFALSVHSGTPPSLSTLSSSTFEPEESFLGLQFAAQVGTDYYIMVDGYSDGTLQFSDEFEFQICLAPANDNFASASDLGSSPAISISGDSSCAIAEPNEPDHGEDFFGNRASNSLWYVWQAPSNGNWEVSVTNSDFDYLVAVHKGSTLETLSEIAAADDFGTESGDGNIIFAATSGTNYSIAVDGFAEGGTFTLNLAPITIVVPEIEEFTADPANGQFSIEFVSEPGETYSLNSSPDLLDWSNVIEAAIPASAGTTTTLPFSDPIASSAGKRFYRLTRN